jgi:SulP family sulfate permease
MKAVLIYAYGARHVVVGFTNGIAVIGSTQVKDFFGLKIDKMPGEFASRILALAHNASSFSLAETTLASIALMVIIFFMIFVKRVPRDIVALFIGTAAVVVFKLPLATIGTRFGGIPSGSPTLKLPHFHLDLLRPLSLQDADEIIVKPFEVGRFAGLVSGKTVWKRKELA